MGYDVYSKFDLKKHKEKYVNYLEVIILEDGTVEYAVPSHQEKLISIVSDKTGWSRQEISDKTPPEYYFDWCEWLCGMSGAVAVWNDYIICGSINSRQLMRLRELKMNGLYRGRIPITTIEKEYKERVA